jgi:hypothetical protein
LRHTPTRFDFVQDAEVEVGAWRALSWGDGLKHFVPFSYIELLDVGRFGEDRSRRERKIVSRRTRPSQGRIGSSRRAHPLATHRPASASAMQAGTQGVTGDVNTRS